MSYGQAIMAVISAITAAKSMQNKGGSKGVSAHGTDVYRPQGGAGSFSKISNVSNMIKSGNDLYNQKNTSNVQDEIEKVKNSNPMKKRLDNYDIQKNPNQMLQMYSQAEQQLNQMPQDQRLQYGPPLYQGMIRTYQDYKQRGIV